MSKQPPNNDQQFDADLAAIENAMNNMMQGAFSMMFKQLTDSSIFESIAFPGVLDSSNETNVTTTILNGNNLNNSTAVIEGDGYGGNDFKRLAKKSKQNRGIIPAEEIVSNEPQHIQQQSSSTSPTTSVGTIFNLLFQQPGAELLNRNADLSAVNTSINNTNQSNEDKGGWSFVSTSSRTVYQPDGTQETIITKKTNGVTETIKQIHYPDGRTEETRDQKSSFWNKLLRW